jgi:hypothetical protein
MRPSRCISRTSAAFDGSVILSTGIQQGLCHSQRHHRIRGKFGTLVDYGKVLAL